MGPFKTDHSSGEYGKQKGGCDFKARSDKKKKTAPRAHQRPHPNKTENYSFFAGETAEQQEHDMEKKSLMENAKAKSSHSSSSSNSALKQMEQMMGRNYSDFMRSLAAKYNQTNTKE